MKHRFFRRNTNSWAILAGLVAIGGFALGLILAGCSDNGLVFEGSYSEERVSFFDQPYYDDALAKRTDIEDYQTSLAQKRLLANQGGVIGLGQDENNEAFVVLPCSFVADTTFTIEITRLVTTDGERVVICNFGPDGLQFSRPAVIRLNLAELIGRNAKSIDFYWLNPETNIWEHQVTAFADENYYVYLDVGHFSKFAYGSDGAVTSK